MRVVLELTLTGVDRRLSGVDGGVAESSGGLESDVTEVVDIGMLSLSWKLCSLSLQSLVLLLRSRTGNSSRLVNVFEDSALIL